MEFGFDDEQTALAASVRDVIESAYGIPYVRRMLDDARGFSAEFWSTAARLGWLGLLVDERFGGTGRGALEMVAVQQELGRGVVPGPFLASAVLATVALQRFGSAQQQERWLPAMAAGGTIATVATQTRSSAVAGTIVATPASASRFYLTGEERFVLDAGVADLLILPARTERGTTLVLVEASAPGIALRPIDTIDRTRRSATVVLDRVEVADDQVLGEIGGGERCLDAILDFGRVALCGEMVGGAERVLETCTAYARVREQFGRPIGTFQAIQHKCADMLLQVESARAMTLAAATSLAHGDDDAASDASIAKACCGDAYRQVATEGVQIHGALGFSWELDVHLFYKRARSSETLLGDARFHRRRIADRFLGEA